MNKFEKLGRLTARIMTDGAGSLSASERGDYALLVNDLTLDLDSGTRLANSRSFTLINESIVKPVLNDKLSAELEKELIKL